MANIPLTYKLSWYDPSKPEGVLEASNANANLATRFDTQYTMQDIINTVSYSGGSIDGSGAQYAVPVFTDTNTITSLPLGNAGEFLTSGGAAANPTWAAGSFLPLVGGTMTGNTLHGDSVKSLYGTGSDLEIFHDGSNSYVKDVGTGDLIIEGSTTLLRSKPAEGSYFKFIECRENTGASIYYQGAEQFITTNTGIRVGKQMDQAGQGGSGVIDFGLAARAPSGYSPQIIGQTNADRMDFAVAGVEVVQIGNTAGDVTITTADKGLVLKSANGTQYRITVANDGTVTSTAV